MERWETLSQGALDDAYANSAHIQGAAAYPARWAKEAAAFRASARAMLDLAYAPVQGAVFDLFLPKGRAAGLIVFVHGGYWRRFGKSDWSHLAQGGVVAGHAVAVVGYPLAPMVPIPEITALVSKAVSTAAALVPGPVRLTGHSAGGHLVSRLMMEDAAPHCWARIAACVPISPVTDLRPLVPQSLNADLRLSPADAKAESPALGTPHIPPKADMAVHVGADERPSFLWQAEILAKAWSIPCQVTPGRHHFDIVEGLCDPGSRLMADILAERS